MDVAEKSLELGLQTTLEQNRTDDAVGYRKLCKEQGLDTRILMVPPFTAFELGYNLYLAQTRPEGSPLKQSAQLVVTQLTAYLTTFNATTPCGAYVANLLMAANGFAAGIERLKKILQSKLAVAEEELNQFLTKYTRGQRLVGFLSGGFKLLLLGGIAFYLATMLISTVGIHVMAGKESGSVSPIDPHYASLATALGITLIGSFFKGWWSDRRISKALQKYDDASKLATDEYAAEALKEYQLAANTANTAWQMLTCIPAPTTRGMENLLRSIITGEDDDAQTTKTEKQPTRWNIFRRLRWKAKAA